MSIVRVSVIGDRVFAPEQEKGALLAGDAKGVADDPDFVGDLGRCAAAKENPKYAEFLSRAVAAQAKKLKPGQPVVVMVHGFLYDPADPTDEDSPHSRNYHFLDDDTHKRHWRHLASWPLGLGFKPDDGGEKGLAVAFGWDSKPRLLKIDSLEAAEEILLSLRKVPLQKAIKFAREIQDFSVIVTQIAATFQSLNGVPDEKQRAVLEGRLEDLFLKVEIPLATLSPYLPDFYAEAYRRAAAASVALIHTITAVASKLPRHAIDIFCHSLGSRVVIESLRQLANAKADPLRRVGRVVIVGGAEYDTVARTMLAATQNAMLSAPSFYNFMSRRDRVLTHVAGKYHPIEPVLTAPIGCYGLQAGMNDPHWIDLQLDRETNGEHPLNAWLKERGVDAVSGPGLPRAGEVAGAGQAGILNHWYYFTRPANMALFAAILRDRTDFWEIARMRRDRVPSPRAVNID